MVFSVFHQQFKFFSSSLTVFYGSFLQIFPQMFQDANIAETFRVKKSQRNKSITSSQLALKNRNIEEFREQIFLHCGMNLNIFKLSTQTQAAFWFMLSNCK
jgi:hypothetical protein